MRSIKITTKITPGDKESVCVVDQDGEWPVTIKCHKKRGQSDEWRQPEVTLPGGLGECTYAKALAFRKQLDIALAVAEELKDRDKAFKDVLDFTV